MNSIQGQIKYFWDLRKDSWAIYKIRTGTQEANEDQPVIDPHNEKEWVAKGQVE